MQRKIIIKKRMIYGFKVRFTPSVGVLEEKSEIDYPWDPADNEHCYKYPIILETNRMTERRVLNLIFYLLGQEKLETYKKYLRSEIPYCKAYNSTFDRYQRNYDIISLWDNLFLSFPELCSVINHRHIRSLDELIYRACEYFN